MRVARPLRRGGRKPRDVGSGLVCASISDGWRRWLSLATPHPEVGYVELTGMPAFDEAKRGDPAAVRAYRALMADAASAFLVIERLGAAHLDVRLLGPRPGDRGIAQRLRLRASAEGLPAGLRLTFRGRLQLPALAMITEPARRMKTEPVVCRLVADGARLRVMAPALGAEAVIEVSGEVDAGWLLGEAGTATCEVSLSDPAATADLVLGCRLLTPLRIGGERPPPRRSSSARQAMPLATLAVPPELQPDVEGISRRAVRYVRECTALTVARGRVAILTDHRLLPLSWTRDAYWQALLLLRHGCSEIVADHLRWLWLDCHRPDATWARSHHADGRRHDDIYQADQQLYPLLELADYRATTGGLPALGASSGDDATWADLVRPVLDDLARRLSDGLLATEENAADDPAGLPYVLANQLLAWHALDAVAEMPEFEGLEPAPLDLAHRLATAVDRHFAVDGPAGSMWAYAVDARGDVLRYHDANDVPTALAPLWGFCGADDSAWQATMDFAFSSANPAYVDGRKPGLGSRHTPGVWPLGLIQEWIARSVCGRRAEAGDALRRLIGCAMQDGSLPEASDPDTGRIVARPWFAWPGALLGALAEPSARRRPGRRFTGDSQPA